MATSSSTKPQKRTARARSKSPGPRKAASATPKPTAKKQVVKDHFEFGGPVGGFGIMIMLPLTILFLFYSCDGEFCLQLNEASFQELQTRLPSDVSVLFSKKAFAIVLAWFSFQVVLERLLPGDVVPGVVLKTGKRLNYNINGHLSFWISLFVLLHGFPTIEDGRLVGFGSFPLSQLYDEYIQLAMAASVFSFVLSVYLFASSYKEGALLADGGNTSSTLYNFFIGRELNPRIGSFDLKEFCELRPGLVGWLVLDIGCAMKQYETFGSVSWSMVLIVLFQGLYVWDAQFCEKAILTTMDITTDGFGWMLCFGDLAWVPFTYSLQARLIAGQNPADAMHPVLLVGIFVLHMAGFAIFRGANGTKDRFRSDPTHPSVKDIKTMTTKTGRKLMISGWWGMARKINYTGDWMMGLAWCMCTGFDCIPGYEYAIYFCILLVHRALRDNEACEKKYGEDWPTYKKHVPYVFIPGII